MSDFVVSFAMSICMGEWVDECVGGRRKGDREKGGLEKGGGEGESRVMEWGREIASREGGKE